MIRDGITYFKKPGRENTKDALDLAIDSAKALGINKMVVASTKGDVARAILGRKNIGDISVIIVTYAYGQSVPGKNPMPEELRRHLVDEGFILCTAAHALSGAERSISSTFGGVYPTEIVANTLRMFGQGMKVCVEISSMAADAGHVVSGEPVIAVGGTGGGADTVVVLRPDVTCRVLKTKIDRIVCMPIE